MKEKVVVFNGKIVNFLDKRFFEKLIVRLIWMAYSNRFLFFIYVLCQI